MKGYFERLGPPDLRRLVDFGTIKGRGLSLGGAPGTALRDPADFVPTTTAPSALNLGLFPPKGPLTATDLPASRSY